MALRAAKKFTLKLHPSRPETLPATGFVGIGRADNDEFLGGAEALGLRATAAADHTDGVHFADVFRNGEKLGHGAKGEAAEVAVEPGDDDLAAAVREFHDKRDNAVVVELGFVDADDLGMRVQFAAEFRHGHSAGGWQLHGGMTLDVAGGVAFVKRVLEKLHGQSR